LRAHSRSLFRDRRGISSTATAALFSIAVLLIFMAYINDIENDRKLFVTIMEFFKAMGFLPSDFDPWEILNSPVGSLAAYIGAYMCMLFAVIVTFVLVKWPLQAVSEISALRRERRKREREEKIREEEAKRRKLRAEELERELELDSLSLLGPSEQLSFAHRLQQYYAKQQKPESERYTGGPRHVAAEKLGEELLIRLGEKNIKRHIHHYGLDIRDHRPFIRAPDYTSKRYIVECKTGRDTDFERMWGQAWQDISIKEQERIDVIWYILEHPLWYYMQYPTSNIWRWQKIINLLESHGVIVRYGDG